MKQIIQQGKKSDTKFYNGSTCFMVDLFLFNFHSKKNLEIVICLESQTFEIQTYLIATKSITTQNLIRKLSRAIEAKIQDCTDTFITLYIENEAWSNSKTSQKLFDDYLNVRSGDSVNDVSESFTIEKENLRQKYKTFRISQISGKTFDQELEKKLQQNASARSLTSLLKTYVNEWNRNQRSGEILPVQKMIENPKIIQVMDQLYKLKSKASESSLTYDDQSQIGFLSKQVDQLARLTVVNALVTTDFMNQRAEELAQQIETIDQKVDEMSSDVKQLLPTEKRKYNPQPLRDPITPEIFQLLIFNAGSKANYQKKIRRAQLRIAYTLLYHLGLRLNELRKLTLENIQEAIERSELRVTLYKTNRSHNVTLPIAAKKDLQEILPDFEYLKNECKFRYLFGKTKTPHKKTLLRIVNKDLANTCKVCGITDNISSHSFRVSVISKLLRVATVQDVADIMGHQDIRSTMKYSRYRLSKSVIQEIHQKAEDSLSKTSW